jgi:hypothetical protein
MAKKRRVNKSQKVRDYLAEHPEAGPTDVATALKQYKVSPALVSSIKGKSGTKRPKRRKARAAKRAIRGRRGRPRGTSQVEPIVAAAELIRISGGLDEAKAVVETAGRIASVLR